MGIVLKTLGGILLLPLAAAFAVACIFFGVLVAPAAIIIEDATKKRYRPRHPSHRVGIYMGYAFFLILAYSTPVAVAVAALYQFHVISK